MAFVVVQQTFRYTIPNEQPDIVWDTGLAAKLAAIPSNIVAAVPIPLDQMAEIAAKNEWKEEHVARVDPAQPGLGAAIYEDGRIVYILIDGQHRNVRAMREGLPFYVRLLTDEASRACVVSGAEHWRLPWNLKKSG